MKVKWQVEDGYCGGSRPHETIIDDTELEECETEEEIEELIEERIKEDFNQKISWYEISRR
jgi:hypothetical protein